MSFYKEIKEHNAPGYHRLYRYSEDFSALSKKEGYSLNSLYTGFINSVGYGYFFGGSLVLFPLAGETGSIKALTLGLQSAGIEDFVVIGYAGTTEGYYCLKNDRKDKAVYWIDIQQKAITKLNERFDDWINAQPNELFSEDIYAGYKKIKDIESIYKVINERSLVEVDMLDFERGLIKPPGKEKDFLPRYNRVNLAIRKNQDIELSQLTIKFFRRGSPIGEDNVEYLTIDVGSLRVDKTEVVQAYLFDPFNLPFEKIECSYSPEIDLASKMRVRYKEIKQFL